MGSSSHRNLPRLVVVGTGNMGKIILKNLAYLSEISLFATDRMESLNDIDFEANQVTYIPEKDLNKTFQAPLNSQDILILATKPQNLGQVCQRWVPLLEASRLSGNHPLVLSILAGTPIATLQNAFCGGIPVVRAMPNVAARVATSATAICRSEQVTDDQMKMVMKILGTIGKTWLVHEELMDVVTGLSGSGPAYLFMVIESMSDGAVKMGMPRKLALELAIQTLLGAALLAEHTELHPAILRDQVTTPGGTTISAIHELERHGLRSMLISAVCQATRKSARLATQITQTSLKKD